GVDVLLDDLLRRFADPLDFTQLPLLHALFEIDVRFANDPADFLKGDDLELVLALEFHQSGERLEEVGKFVVERHVGILRAISTAGGADWADLGSLRSKEAGKGGPRMAIDARLLRSLIRDAAREAFDELRQAHLNENLYAFALYADDRLMKVIPAANSE